MTTNPATQVWEEGYVNLVGEGEGYLYLQILHAGVALRRFTALHCALAREFVLPLKSVGEVLVYIVAVHWHCEIGISSVHSGLIVHSVHCTTVLSNLRLQLFSESLRTLQDRGVLQSFERGEVSLNCHEEQHFLFLRHLLLPFVAGVWVSDVHA